MFRKSFSIFVVVVFLAAFDAHAYYLSATDGSNLFVFKAEAGSAGNLAVISELKYAAPGTMGSTALLPSPSSTETKKVFDLFGVYSSAGKPVLFRDRIEFDEASAVFRFVSRKTFKKHKLDSYNTISSAILQDVAAEVAADQRFLLTKSGTNINLRKVTGTGKLTGGNKPTFKNPSSFQTLSAAVSPDGAFAIQSFVAATSSGSGTANATMTRGISIKDVINDLIAHFTVSGDIFSLSLTADALCAAFAELQGDTSRARTVQGSAAAKIGYFYFPIDKSSLQPGKVVTVAKMKPTTLSQYHVFNTGLLLPDGKGIIFSKEKTGKLEFLHQPLNGSCGPKLGKPKEFLSRANPTIQQNNPLYGFAAAACASGLLKGFC
jgi:hypothetical protein